MKSLFDQDDKVHVSDTEVDTLKKVFLDKAIPRYLSPLESGGRSIKPCLIHSDLWPGKIKPMASTDELCLFDACAYWGHNEGELSSHALLQANITETHALSRPRNLPQPKVQARPAVHQKILAEGTDIPA